jgi:hypothetical protein
MSDSSEEGGREGEESRATPDDGEERGGDDDELAYLKGVAAILRPGTWSNGGQVGDKLPLPQHLKSAGVTLKELVVEFPNIVEMKVEGTTTFYRRSAGLRVDGSQSARKRDAVRPAGASSSSILGDIDSELAYLQEVAALLSPSGSWSRGSNIAIQCPPPLPLKMKGVKLKQLVVKYPDIVEMKYNAGGDVSYRRVIKARMLQLVKVRLDDPVAVPGNPNLRVPIGHVPQDGDWICERPGCGNLNFKWREKCGNIICDATRPASTPSAPLVPGDNDIAAVNLDSWSKLGDVAAQPSNPNLRLPKEFRDGDWTCERRGCGNVNFAWREKCESFDCDATRPAGVPSMTPIRGDNDDELAYIKDVAALLSLDSWSAGGSIGSKCPLPRHLKAKGVTFKQLVVKYPNIVEMRYNAGGDVAYRLGDLSYLPAVPGIPSFHLPEETRHGEWMCERPGCRKLNFASRRMCSNFECAGLRPSDMILPTFSSSSSSSSSSFASPPPYTPREDPGAAPTELINEATYQFAEDAFVRRLAAGLKEDWVRLFPHMHF